MAMPNVDQYRHSYVRQGRGEGEVVQSAMEEAAVEGKVPSGDLRTRTRASRRTATH